MHNTNALLNEFYDIIQDPYVKMQETKGSRYFGFNCIFIPEEIIHAAGFTPVRILGVYNDDQYNETYFHRCSCEFARNLLHSYLDGCYDFLDGSVFSQCCDALFAVYQNLEKMRKNVYYFWTPFHSKPSGFGSEWANHFIVKKINEFIHFFKDNYQIKITNNDILESMKIYRENISLLNKLTDYYQQGLITCIDYYAIRKASLFIRKEKHNALLNKLFSGFDLTESKGNNHNSRKKLLISGFLNADMEWIHYFYKMGIELVADDLCCFSRYAGYGYPADSYPADDQNTLMLLAKRISSKKCPVKVGSNQRYEDLIKRYHESGAEGILFFIYQFCDIQALEYAQFSHKFKNEGIRTLFIQPSLHYKDSGQIDTRIEAFLEML